MFEQGNFMMKKIVDQKIFDNKNFGQKNVLPNISTNNFEQNIFHFIFLDQKKAQYYFFIVTFTQEMKMPKIFEQKK